METRVIAWFCEQWVYSNPCVCMAEEQEGREGEKKGGREKSDLCIDECDLKTNKKNGQMVPPFVISRRKSLVS